MVSGALMLQPRLYYWKGMKKDILMHSKHCQTCSKQCVNESKYIKDNFWPATMPMEFISMDLVGRFSRITSDHEYALTVICMLTGYVFCIPLKSKSAEEIMDKYLAHVAFRFGSSRKMLSDNGTELKNSLFEEVTKLLGVEYKIYSPVYRPHANGWIEGFHKFLKECIAKTLSWWSWMGWYFTTYSCSLQLVPKWTLKGSFILSNVWVRCSDTSKLRRDT